MLSEEVNNLLIGFQTITYGNVWIHLCIYYVIVLRRTRDLFTKLDLVRLVYDAMLCDLYNLHKSVFTLEVLDAID